MKTIGRYIIRHFLINFVLLLCVLMTLFVLVDLVIDLDEFIKGGQARADMYGSVLLGTIVTIVGYYGPLVVLLYVYFSGLLVTAAMGFTFTALHRGQELVAMVGSGVSMYRVAAPVLVVGVALNALTLPAQEFILPPLAPRLMRSKSDLSRARIQRFPVDFIADAHHNLLAAAEYDDQARAMSHLTIIERDADGLATGRITADRAVWRAGRQGWALSGGQETRPQGSGLARRAPTPVDFFATEVSPQVLLARHAASYKQMLSLRQLEAMSANPALHRPQRAQVTRIIWGRFSLLVVNVLILVMGLPFFLVLLSRNPLKRAIMAAGVCVGAWSTGLMLLQTPVTVMPPVAAAWLPAAVFLVAAIVLLQWIKT